MIDPLLTQRRWLGCTLLASAVVIIAVLIWSFTPPELSPPELSPPELSPPDLSPPEHPPRENSHAEVSSPAFSSTKISPPEMGSNHSPMQPSVTQERTDPKNQPKDRLVELEPDASEVNQTLHSALVRPASESSDESRPDPEADDIDPSAFTALLWNPPPPPEEPTPNPAEQQRRPPPQPLHAELIGIILRGSDQRAALYDRKGDRIVILEVGESLGAHTIQSITNGKVEFSDGRGTTVLQLNNNSEGRL